jgi:hypothetical protein
MADDSERRAEQSHGMKKTTTLSRNPDAFGAPVVVAAGFEYYSIVELLLK